MNSTPHLLHLSHVKTQTLIVNRLSSLFHFTALTLLIFYRASSLILTTPQPFIPHLLIFISELTLSFIWLLTQSFLWRPITRAVFPERLPEDHHLPAIDVFICTADPQKEPPLGVMNTVMSAMVLDYPVDKLSVYLSDDAGCPATLEAMREAWRFGKTWVPFCRKYGVKTICPEAYFAGENVGDEAMVDDDKFEDEKVRIKEEYELFREKVTKISQRESSVLKNDHSCVVEVIGDELSEGSTQMPLLVYVSREKRPSHPHHFKAGALNALLRVSSLMSNAPYILGLDCDMYCNDANSARQAMCFHLHPKLSSTLAFVQFPQTFHNISKHDIYDSELRSAFKLLWLGMDGAKGPCLSGTCYYLKREALYGPPSNPEASSAHLLSNVQGIDLLELKQRFGLCNEFIKSLNRKYVEQLACGNGFSNELVEETKVLASCEYENDTKWGKEVGFRYFSVVEDLFTSMIMHCNGWRSVYYMPSRPSFLGAGTTSLNDSLIQTTRWSTGLAEVALSRFSPIIYGLSRMSIVQSMCYGWLAFYGFDFLPMWILATVPPLSLLHGIPLYPEVKNPFFYVFLCVFLSSNLQNMRHVLSTGASHHAWKHEQRIWMIKGITSHLYAAMHAIMEKLGVKDASFLPTNKVIDEDDVKMYQKGVYNFQTSSVFLVPLCSLIILSLIAFVVGIVKIVFRGDYFNEMFVQIFLSLFVVLMGYPVLEGMVLRNDKGKIATSISCYSVVFSVIIFFFGSLVVVY